MLPISRQEAIDRIMCKPGYNWLDMPYSKNGGKCVAGGYNLGPIKDGPRQPEMPKPEQPEMPSPDAAVKQEKAMRTATPKAIK